MNFDERFAQTQAKMEELKARFNDTVESAKKADQQKKDEILVKLAKLDAAIEDFNRDVEAQVYCDYTALKDEAKADMEAISQALDDIDNKIDAKVNDGIATVEGTINAAEENNRLAKERYESKMNAVRLEAQMNIEAAKGRVEAKKEAVDKAAQEQRIKDLLDYADGCYQLALAYAMEAELAVLDACEEAEDYNAKYGDKGDKE